MQTQNDEQILIPLDTYLQDTSSKLQKQEKWKRWKSYFFYILTYALLYIVMYALADTGYKREYMEHSDLILIRSFYICAAIFVVAICSRVSFVLGNRLKAEAAAIDKKIQFIHIERLYAQSKGFQYTENDYKKLREIVS